MSSSSGSFALGLIVLLIPLMLAAGAVVLIVLGLVGRRGTARLPGCGACGYAVKGLESLTCPECGADLREVGIAKPGGRAGRNAMLVSGLVLLAMVMLLVCGGMWFMVIPQSGSHSVPSTGPLHSVPAPTP